MNSQMVNAFFFPTQVWFVDDDSLFVKTLIASLDHEASDYVFSDNPVEVAQKLLGSYKPNEFLDSAISWPEQGVNSTALNVNIQEISKIVYNPNRFSEITVLVTDFNMPQQTGQQLCEEVSDLPIKKLMITSEADEKLAVNLLNKSIINKFVKKTRSVGLEMDFVDMLQTMIQELQQSYFKELSREVIKSITSSKDYYPGCVNNAEFIKLFKQLMHDNTICEYYLIDTSGSFLFLSASGAQSYLLVNTEDNLRTSIELMECSDSPNLEVLASLKKGEKILYWNKEHDFPVSSQEQFLQAYPAQKIANYYYSYVKDRNILGLDSERIVSFRQYLKNK